MDRPSTNDERSARIILEQEEFLNEVRGILRDEQTHDEILRAVVLSSDRPRLNAIRDLDPERVYALSSIRALCVRYRLRFLDACWFRGVLPSQAVHALRQLEQRAAAPLAGFKVLAPARHFKLGDCEGDPMLFVQISEDRYYLVHRWGGRLTWGRALVNWPLRSPVQLAVLVVLVGWCLAALAPTALIAPDPSVGWWGAHRLVMWLWTTMVFASFTAFGWFAFFGRFSAEAWNSRHFN